MSIPIKPDEGSLRRRHHIPTGIPPPCHQDGLVSCWASGEDGGGAACAGA